MVRRGGDDGGTWMTIGHWLEPEAIALRLGADSKRQALAALAELGARTLRKTPSVLMDALLAREAEGSTGMGDGVALPHARIAGLDGLHAAFMRLETPVDFDAVDGKPVDLLLALFAPADADVGHLRALARASRMLRRGEFREQLRKARTADAVYALLAQDTSTSAA